MLINAIMLHSLFYQNMTEIVATPSYIIKTAINKLKYTYYTI